MTSEQNPTEKALLDALSRLIQNKPKNTDLKLRLQRKGFIKISKSVVEIEAGLSNGSSKRHPGVLKAIENANTTPDISENEPSESKLIEQSYRYSKLEKKYNRSLENRKKAEDKIESLKEELERKDEILEHHLAKEHELMVCLWNAIPPADIESRILHSAANFRIKTM
ncbi:hypothetical protein L9X50_09465 [Vibrio aestuarianus]|uniref:hypothetical protein n=1 Tax=Vibrio aestuarianus TaxID=28171 RepID=UPI00237CD27A|nr:hypothetical protein [Vibrio aestuarianus]MDE1318233.1 hypothetical protein [Vibrio aestuarianus]